MTHLVEHTPGRAATASETSGLVLWAVNDTKSPISLHLLPGPNGRVKNPMGHSLRQADAHLTCPVITLLTALLRDRVAEAPINLLGGLAFPTNMEDFNSTTEASAIHNS